MLSHESVAAANFLWCKGYFVLQIFFSCWYIICSSKHCSEKKAFMYCTCQTWALQWVPLGPD